MNVLFKKLHANAIIPTKGTKGSAAFAICACLDNEIRLKPGERCIIPTGIALAIPPRFAGLILPHNDNAKNHGIMVTNSPGLIDPDYRREVKVLLYNAASTSDFIIHPGDRIAQLLFVQTSAPIFAEAQELDETIRGIGGFGSTGTGAKK